MKKLLALLVLLPLAACDPGTGADAPPELADWEARAGRVTIVRDEWGIPHSYGRTDADAVFGMIYAQAEDDFNRIEVNFLNSQGRLAEAEGEDAVWRDLRMKLFIDPEVMRGHYADSPEWLRDLMDAWAAGLNYYLHTHPDVEPRVLDRFEPWMALTFSEGSIGGDMERPSLSALEAFYGEDGTVERVVGGAAAQDRAASADPAMDSPVRFASADPAMASPANPVGVGASDPAAVSGLAPLPGHDPTVEPTGSNGFAIAATNTESGDETLLLINPHTSFYFRAENHMASEEGLNAYGATTWGQFFIYQGFNETAGWMHTSTGADAIDEYYYDVEVRSDGVYYPYDGEMRKMEERTITLPFRSGEGGSGERTVTAYFTHHGPVVRGEGTRWVAVKLMNDPVNALTQSYLRTKAANYDEFLETMRLHTNSSNNTVFADAEGNIAYFQANHVPIRSTEYDWDEPVSGMTSDTEYQGVHSVEESPLVVNPETGWLQNTNNAPWSVTGEGSLDQDAYPPYMDTYGQNYRGEHAIMVLEGRTDFTLQRLIDAAYDSYLPAFEDIVPALVAAWDAAPEGDPAKSSLEGPVSVLREWNLRFGEESVPTSVAVFYGDTLRSLVLDEARAAGTDVYEYMADGASDDRKLEALAAAVARLEEAFGDWRTPWGEINRFQRLTGDIVQPFDDARPSTPVGFTSARWGSLAAYGQRTFNGTDRIYGTRGNSFVAVVSFGDSLRARAITAGGQSGDPSSPHFDDQIERYATGDLRPVRFYRPDVDAHAEETYVPGRR